ncbi:MAG TPA: MFS transporter [Acidiferrobacteraceae bacterium]|nr:MFS transporter [Acidiferrobacteraceae bacterium]
MSPRAEEVDGLEVGRRLDRLPWSAFHRRVLLALGITWVLDGLEVTLVGSLAGALAASPALRLSPAGQGFAASAYVLGAVLGSLIFGYLADRFGRKRLFSVTLGLYVLGTLASSVSWSPASFLVFRALTGTGIGGEYSAINSAIQELMGPTYRGRTDIIVNGSFWLGAALGAAASVLFLKPGLLPPDVGWRLALGAGGLLGLVILRLRRHIPESPRWLVLHGRIPEAVAVVGAIEHEVQYRLGRPLPPPQSAGAPVRRISFADAARLMLSRYQRRALLGFTLMASQAFLYNAFFFTYGSVLLRFYHTAVGGIGWYLLPFALSNWLGAVLLARLFDTWGRRRMITATYVLSGLLMLVVSTLFREHLLTAISQTAAWAVLFFFASAAASSAYLTVSEIFPLPVRATAIALFYTMGTAVGGIFGPAVFGGLIESGSRSALFWGYALAAALMLLAGLAEWCLGIAAEGRPLEQVAEVSD